MLMSRKSADAANLKIALFSGNYNCVRDGANRALNRLVAHLLDRGATVRVYSPTNAQPAFAPAGELVSVPSMPLPFGRSEYRVAWRIPRDVRADIADFAPDLFHISLPLFLGKSALRLARRMHVPVVASMHTRFETYPRYYGCGFLERPLTAHLRRFYNGCDAVVAPCESAARVMHSQRMADRIGIWSRGVDRQAFNPAQRDMSWRRGLGLRDEDTVIAFLGRLVMEKGLADFAAAIELLRAAGKRCSVLVIGDGPARSWFEQRLDNAIFLGHTKSGALARALASADVLLNPSVTESFGNVTLEAMASGLPVVAYQSTGSNCLVRHGISGQLCPPGDLHALAASLQLYIEDSGLRRAHGKAGRDFSAAFAWDEVNDALISTYLSVLNLSGAPSVVKQSASADVSMRQAQL